MWQPAVHWYCRRNQLQEWVSSSYIGIELIQPYTCSLPPLLRGVRWRAVVTRNAELPRLGISDRWLSQVASRPGAPLVMMTTLSCRKFKRDELMQESFSLAHHRQILKQKKKRLCNAAFWGCWCTSHRSGSVGVRRSQAPRLDSESTIPARQTPQS